MYIGKVSIKTIVNGTIYLKVKTDSSIYDMAINKNDSIVALCDFEYNSGDNVPTLNRFSYDEIISDINQDDENDLYFETDLRYICGISIV